MPTYAVTQTTNDGVNVSEQTLTDTATFGGGGERIKQMAVSSNAEIGNTTTETTVWEFSFEEMTTAGDSVKVEFSGAVLNFLSVSRVMTLRIYVGVTKVYDDSTTFPNSVNRERGVIGQIFLVCNGAQNSNSLTGFIGVGGTGTSTTGSGDLGSDEIQSWALITNRDCDVATTGGTTLRMTVQFDQAGSNLVYYHDFARLLRSVST